VLPVTVTQMSVVGVVVARVAAMIVAHPLMLAAVLGAGTSRVLDTGISYADLERIVRARLLVGEPGCRATTYYSTRDFGRNRTSKGLSPAE
jgi:hypothetical protein